MMMPISTDTPKAAVTSSETVLSTARNAPRASARLTCSTVIGTTTASSRYSSSDDCVLAQNSRESPPRRPVPGVP